MVMVDQTAALLVHAGHAPESRLATTMLNATMHQHIVELVTTLLLLFGFLLLVFGLTSLILFLLSSHAILLKN